MTTFTDHTVLVTGATGGIGRALCADLTRRGAAVLATARNPDALEKLATHDAITPLPADLATQAGVTALLDLLDAHRVTGVIHNAGLQREIFATDPAFPEQARAEIAVNLQAPMLLTAALLPRLKGPEPFLCFVTSLLALTPKAAAPSYCATKAGLRSFTRALRYQAATETPDLLINEALPALVDTAMTAGRGRGKDSPETVAHTILDGLARRQPETWIGKARTIRALHWLSPRLTAKILK